MKRNITINLNGRLYHIDEDAYAVLSQYTTSLHSYFIEQEGGDEIVKDIEGRISELFDELQAAGVEAITIEHVQDIISRIGELSDLTEGETVDEYTSDRQTPPPPFPGDNDIFTKIQNAVDLWFAHLKGRRFYCDKNNAMLAGVLSGCSNYFGGTPFMWRLCFVLLLLFLCSVNFWPSFFLISFLYVIVAILAPEAVTPDQRLKMKGIKVTPQNLANEVASDTTTPPPYSPSFQERASEFGASATTVLSKIFHGMILILGIGVLFFAAVIFCMLVAFFFSRDYMIDTMFSDRSFNAMIYHIPTLWALGISVLLTALIAGYGLFRYGISGFTRVRPMGTTQAVLWLITLVICISGIVASSVVIAGVLDDYYSRHNSYICEIMSSAFII